jgi:hypothetical protein
MTQERLLRKTQETMKDGWVQVGMDDETTDYRFLIVICLYFQFDLSLEH